MKPKISLSIADIPLGIPLSESFKLAAECKVDGVEVVLATKTRFFQQELNRLSLLHNVPILSVHQPPWSFLGIWYDENMFHFASHHKARINAHPLKDFNIEGKKAHHFFSWLSKKSKEHNVPIMIENMPIPKKYVPVVSAIFLSDCHPTTADFKKLAHVCETYKFGFTLDTDHLHLSEPHKSEEFEQIYPHLANVHISSFDKMTEHMPLYKGFLKVKEFLQGLRKREYSGLVTLELTPHYIYPKKEYFEDVRRSIEILQNELH